jgi:hypothetical protein
MMAAYRPFWKGTRLGNVWAEMRYASGKIPIHVYSDPSDVEPPRDVIIEERVKFKPFYDLDKYYESF